MSTDVSTVSSLASGSNPRAANFVVMTAAYNEQENIAKTIESMLSQTLRPQRWVIASDGSTNGTDAIVERYAAQYDFIRFLRISRSPGRSFGSKVAALHKAYELFDGVAYDFIGNLDADVTFDPSYYAELIAHFERAPQLGIAGGLVLKSRTESFKDAARIEFTPWLTLDNLFAAHASRRLMVMPSSNTVGKIRTHKSARA